MITCNWHYRTICLNPPALFFKHARNDKIICGFCLKCWINLSLYNEKHYTDPKNWTNISKVEAMLITIQK